MNIFKGYVRTKNKRAIDPYKGVSNLRTLEEVEDLEEYAGVLSDDIVMKCNFVKDNTKLQKKS